MNTLSRLFFSQILLLSSSTVIASDVTRQVSAPKQLISLPEIHTTVRSQLSQELTTITSADVASSVIAQLQQSERQRRLPVSTEPTLIQPVATSISVAD